MELSLVSGVATDIFPELIRNGILLYCAFFERWIGGFYCTVQYCMYGSVEVGCYFTV